MRTSRFLFLSQLANTLGPVTRAGPGGALLGPEMVLAAGLELVDEAGGFELDFLASALCLACLAWARACSIETFAFPTGLIAEIGGLADGAAVGTGSTDFFLEGGGIFAVVRRTGRAAPLIVKPAPELIDRDGVSTDSMAFTTLLVAAFGLFVVPVFAVLEDAKALFVGGFPFAWAALRICRPDVLDSWGSP